MRILVFTLLCLAGTTFAEPIQLPTSGQPRTGATGIGPQQDAHYTVSFQSADPLNRSNASNFYAAWIAEQNDVKWAADAPWITPLANGLADLPGGVYTFAVRFDLPANVTSLDGSLFVDDRVEVWLNGRLIADLPTNSESGYWAHTLSSFAITSGFLLGTNLLEFRVFNTHPNTPVGLAVTSLTANTATIPEPTSLVLLGSGLAALAATLRRKQKGASYV